jgi:ABC-type nitrate/sulfonate/bicarbonate transport system permease component
MSEGSRRKGSTRSGERILSLISPIGLLLAWQILIMLGVGDRRFVPEPTDIAVRFWQMTISGELAAHVVVSLYRIFAGFFIGVVPAIAVGLLMAMSRPLRIFMTPLIAALFPIPKVALFPLILLAFGFGDASKIALVAIGVFFPVIINTFTGAANIDRIYIDVASNYGAGRFVMFSRIVFFGALPMIFAGLRVGLAVSFIVLISAEFVAAKTGIGYLIWNSWELLSVDVMFVGIVTVGFLGLITSVILDEIEHLAIPWKSR